MISKISQYIYLSVLSLRKLAKIYFTFSVQVNKLELHVRLAAWKVSICPTAVIIIPLKRGSLLFALKDGIK